MSKKQAITVVSIIVLNIVIIAAAMIWAFGGASAPPSESGLDMKIIAESERLDYLLLYTGFRTQFNFNSVVTNDADKDGKLELFLEPQIDGAANGGNPYAIETYDNAMIYQNTENVDGDILYRRLYMYEGTVIQKTTELNNPKKSFYGRWTGSEYNYEDTDVISPDSEKLIPIIDDRENIVNVRLETNNPNDTIENIVDMYRKRRNIEKEENFDINNDGKKETLLILNNPIEKWIENSGLADADGSMALVLYEGDSDVEAVAYYLTPESIEVEKIDLDNGKITVTSKKGETYLFTTKETDYKSNFEKINYIGTTRDDLAEKIINLETMGYRTGTEWHIDVKNSLYYGIHNHSEWYGMDMYSCIVVSGNLKDILGFHGTIGYEGLGCLLNTEFECTDMITGVLGDDYYPIFPQLYYSGSVHSKDEEIKFVYEGIIEHKGHKYTVIVATDYKGIVNGNSMCTIMYSS